MAFAGSVFGRAVIASFHYSTIPLPMSRRTAISREGYYYLAVLALVLGGAMMRDVNLLLLLAGLMSGPVVFGWRAVGLTLRGLDVERKLPRSLCADDLLVVHLEVNNTRRKVGSWAVVLEDRVEREEPGPVGRRLRPSVLFPHLPAGSLQSGSYRGRLPARGRYRFGPLRMATRFPFGLFARTLGVGRTETLVVFPKLGRLTRHWAARHREAFAGVPRRERRHGTDGDFYGLRPWRQGDSRRWIDWRSSARRGTLLVRQFEQPRHRDLALLVDLWQPARSDAVSLDAVELAVSFAATVVTDLCRKGDAHLHLMAAGRRIEQVRGPTSVPLLNEALQCLAVADADSRNRLPEALARFLREADPGAELVLATSRSIDLRDVSRFAAVFGNPALAARLRQVRVIDASDEELRKYFEVIGGESGGMME